MADPYLYPQSNVLKNKFDIRNAERLAEIENDIVYIKLFSLDELYESISLDIDGLKATHKYLFEDIYTWAGELRTINIYKYERVIPGKSVEYGEHTKLQALLYSFFSKLEHISWDKLSAADCAKTFSRAYAALWKIHPFREGNTRAVTTFMSAYAHKNKLNMDFSILSKHSAYVRESLVLASIDEYSEYEHLEKIVLDAMGFDEAGEYERINEYAVKDYYYRQFDTDK